MKDVSTKLISLSVRKQSILFKRYKYRWKFHSKDIQYTKHVLNSGIAALPCIWGHKMALKPPFLHPVPGGINGFQPPLSKTAELLKLNKGRTSVIGVNALKLPQSVLVVFVHKPYKCWSQPWKDADNVEVV